MPFRHPILFLALMIAAFSPQNLHAQENPVFSNSDHWGLSSGGKTIVEGPPFNYYNYRGDYEYGHIPVDISREVYEAVKGSH